MARNYRRATRQAQEGSAGTVVVLAMIVVLVWWQWDRISAFFGSRLGVGGAVAEVLDYRCERQEGGRMFFDGRVRNASGSPVELRAVTAIYDGSGKKSDYREATVRPVPLQPGQVGDFRGDAPALPDGGACRLDGFVDSVTGRAVSRTGRH